MPTIKTTKSKVLKKVVVKKPVAKKIVKTAASKIKKTPVKKQTTKKVTSSKDLVFANNQTSFWVKNGQILNSLIALRDALDEMEKEVYLYHAGGKHNDFSNWVAAVLSDVECAEALEKAKTQKAAKTIVVKHLKTYKI